MQKILLIEDSEECRMVVKQTLSSPQIQVATAANLQEAKTLLFNCSPENAPDLILLDLSLPDGDGFELLDQLQADSNYQKVPVYLMTGNREIASKVAAFRLGAEDYLVKPVNPVELKARIEMRLRKNKTKRNLLETLQKGALTLHVPLMKASIRSAQSEESIEFTAKEFKILLFLAQNEGRVYSRAELVEVIWGKSVHVLDRTVDSHVCSLRRKLGSHSHYIESVPGSGYCFNSSDSVGTPVSTTATARSAF